MRSRQPRSNIDASIVITTKNRKDELRNALESAVNQSARAEVVVIDDGSTDGTSGMVESEFPSVRLHRSATSRGLIVQRNRAAELATAPVVVSIDDDATFSTPHVVEQTLAAFDHPRIGAVAIPFVNVLQDEDKVLQSSPSADGVFVTDSFIGTAHALRRELFLKLGGYRTFLFHQGEEGDFCARMLDAGYVVRLGSGDPIHHFESPRRDFRRMDHYGRRNDVLYAWYNVPMPAFPLHLAGTTLRGLRFGVQCGRPLRMLRGLASGYTACLHEWWRRQPVSRRAYCLIRTLRKRGPLTFDSIQDRMPIRAVQARSL